MISHVRKKESVFLCLLVSLVSLREPALLAAPPSLSLPVGCAIGEAQQSQCWLQTLVDHDSGSAVRDFRCGARSYNAASRFGRAHQGTDIGVLDWASSAGAVDVLASAPGRVARTRDGIPDKRTLRGTEDTQLKRSACGNGVVIDHGGGWETQYCHLKLGSVRVTVGDQLVRGQRIGTIGVSGLASHPHLHFQLSKREGDQRIPIDPFDGTRLTDPCDAEGAPLWNEDARKALVYRPVELIKAGFTIGDVTDLTLLMDLRAKPELAWSEQDVVKVFLYFSGTHPDAVTRIAVRDPSGAVVLSGSRKTTHYRTRQYVTAALTTARRFEGRAGTYRFDYEIVSADGKRLKRGHVSAALTPQK